MKKLFYILIALTAVACVASCKKEAPVTSTKQLSVVKSDLSFECGGGVGSIVVEAQGAVTATSDKSWAQVSVSGNTITVTCGAWTQLESRNAKITVKCGDESADITAIQRGVTFSLDGILMADELIFTSKGLIVELPFTANADVVEADSEQEWLAVGFDNDNHTLVIVTETNTEMQTRKGTFTVKVGDVILEYNVFQYPPFVQTEDWSMRFGENTETATKLQVNVAQNRGYFVADYVSAGEYSRANLADPTFVEMVMVPKITREIKSQIAYYNYRYGWTSFMTNKSGAWTFDRLEDGDYLGFVVGFDAQGYPTGYYSKSEIFIGELSPYKKWLGQWNVTSVSGAEEVWTFTEKEEDKTYWVTGINGVEPGAYVANDFRAEVKFDAETEGLVFAVWENTGVTWTDSSRGACNTLLSGQYTNTAGKTYYNSGVGTIIATAQLAADGYSAEVTPGTVTSGGAPATFHNIRWYGRYTKSDGSRTGFSWTNVETPLPNTMVKK